MRERRPPRVAEAILAACLPGGGYRESVLGDLEEGYRRRAAEAGGGRWRAAAWYWTNALRIGAGYAVRRLLRRRYRPLERAPRPGATTRRIGLGQTRADVRFALRSYRRSPGFLTVALVTLALGIGANTTIFSVVRTVYFEPLPFHEPGRLVRIGLRGLDRPGTMSVHTAGDFREWRERTSSFEAMAAWGYRTVTVERGDAAERVTAVLSVGSLFDVLGRPATTGRAFSGAEEGPGGENLAVLSHAYWRRAFGSEDAVGSILRIDGTPHRVIGVMPAEFAYPRAADLWMTAPFDAETLSARNDYFLRTVARLGEGVSVERAREEMGGIAASTRERFPETYAGIGIAVEPMGEWLRAGTGSLWWILMAGVVLVLLIGCVNLANLLLSRGTNRRSEYAVRRALGAGEGRLVRQALTESLVLALGGGALGVLVGWLLLEALLRWMPGGVPRAASVGIDPGILAFTLGMSLLAGLLFGALPALKARRDAIGSRLRRRGGSERASPALIAAEIAMAVILLSAAGLTVRSFTALSSREPGIETRHLAAARISIPNDRPSGERHAFYRRLEGRLARLPGVRSVGLVSSLPVVDFTPGAWVNEPGVTHEGGDRPSAKYQVVSPGYFETAGVELLRGRLLTRDDGVEGSPSVLVSRAAARELFPGEDPVGKRFDLGLDANVAPLSTVVGVVDDVKLDGLDEMAPAAVYAVQELIPWWEGFQVMLRLEPGAPVPRGIREAIRGLDPSVPFLGVRRMDDLLAGSLSGRRNTMFLFGLLGLVALVLSAVGVFGVLAYLVGRRTREIGIRMAIGADPVSVRARVLRQGMIPVAIGLGTGLAATAALGRFLESLIFGVRPLDAPTLLGVTALLLAVAAVAIYLPARRASRVDPVRVLAAE